LVLKDYRRFQKFSDAPKTKTLDGILARSAFKTVPARQLTEANKEFAIDGEFQPASAVLELVAERTRGVITSVPVERVNGMQKNHSQFRGCKKWRRPERAFGIAIASRILQTQHKYNKVKRVVILKRKSIKLHKNAYGKRKQTPTLDVTKVATIAAKASYFSPKPESTGKPAADRYLLKEMDLFPATLAENAFMGCCSEALHGVVFSREQGSSSKIPWHFGLCHFAGTCCAALAVDLAKVPGYDNFLYVNFDVAETRPHLFAITDWELNAHIVQWRSWSWQCEYLPNAVRDLRPGIRAFVDSAPKKMVEIAAEAGWWNLNLTTLRELAKFFKWPIAQDEDTFHTLFEMTKQARPGKSDDEILSYIAPRLKADPRFRHGCSDILIEVDEAAKCLERDDEERLVKEKHKASDATHVQDTFKAAWAKKRRQIAEARAKAKAKCKAKGKGKAAPAVARILPASMDMMLQTEAKRWMPPPPKSFIWKSRGDSAWHTCVEPFPECSRSVARHGAEALKMVLSDAWRSWCLREGVDVGACPMRGLIAS
jgi:hypothetical protein